MVKEVPIHYGPCKGCILWCSEHSKGRCSPELEEYTPKWKREHQKKVYEVKEIERVLSKNNLSMLFEEGK